MASQEDLAQQYHEKNAREGYMPTLPEQRQQPQAASAPTPWGDWAAANNAPMVGATQAQMAAYQGFLQNEQKVQERIPRAQQRTEMPTNPAEALRYQFYGAQDAERQQREYTQQALEAYGAARGEAAQAHQESQARNETIMREGLQQRMAEQAAVRQQNLEMMRQRQATLQHMFGLLREGGQGSLSAFMSPLGSEMGQTYQMGMQTGQDYGGYYQGMMGTPDTSSQYTGAMGNLMGQTQVQAPDFSAWMDPESMRSSWYLPPQTTVQQTIPNSPNAPAGQSFFNAPQVGPPQSQLFDYQRNPQQWVDVVNQFLTGYQEGAQGG